MSTYKCQAKNPAYCPHHGSPTILNHPSMKSRIDSLFNKQPVFFAPFSEPLKSFKAIVEINPITPSSKQVYKVEVEGEDYESMLDEVANQVDGLDIKGLKSGYRWKIYGPSNDSSASVDTNLSEGIDQSSDNNKNIKNSIKESLEEAKLKNENSSNFINELKDSSIAQSPSGAKVIALVEAMNSFNFFKDTYNKKWGAASISHAVQLFTSDCSEYTNRGDDIRVHASYNLNGGGLREAKFALDRPSGSYFKQKQVDNMNGKLKEYFASFDKKNS